MFIMMIFFISPAISLGIFSAFPYCGRRRLIETSAMQNFLSWPVQDIKLLRGQWIRKNTKELRICEIWLYEIGLEEMQDFNMEFDVQYFSLL